jgi:hypothetical protein
MRDDLGVVEITHRGRVFRYLTYAPAAPVPAPDVVVHNHVRPVSPLGLNGFRAWLEVPRAGIEVCPCAWRPEIGPHYRVKR